MPAARHCGDEVMTHTCCQSTRQRRNDTERTPVRRRVESSSGGVRADGVIQANITGLLHTGKTT